MSQASGRFLPRTFLFAEAKRKWTAYRHPEQTKTHGNRWNWTKTKLSTVSPDRCASSWGRGGVMEEREVNSVRFVRHLENCFSIQHELWFLKILLTKILSFRTATWAFLIPYRFVFLILGQTNDGFEQWAICKRTHVYHERLIGYVIRWCCRIDLSDCSDKFLFEYSNLFEHGNSVDNIRYGTVNCGQMVFISWSVRSMH